MSQFQYANNPATTLAASATAGATSISVTSAADFPTQGKFTIIIGSEIMLVTGVSGTTWTVTRGYDGTSAAAHNNNAAVVGVLTVQSFLNSAHLDVRAYGAKGNGVADDTAAIQAALTAATDAGGGIVYIPPGSYLTTTALNIGANTQVRGAGLASKITQATADSPVLQANTVNKVTVRDLWLVGGNVNTRTNNRAVHLNAVTDGLISNVRAESCYKSISVFSSNNVTVENCYVAGDVTTSSSVGGAIDFNGCTRCIARGNRVDTPALHGIDAHNAGSDSIIEGNHVWSAGSTGIVVSGSASTGVQIPGCSVQGNVVRDGSYGIIIENGARYCRIVGNFVYSPTNDAILLSDGTGDPPSSNLVEGNVIREAGQYGIYAFNSTYTTIVGNRLSNGANDGIRVNAGTGHVVSANHVSDCAAGAAIRITNGAEGTVVSGNFVRNNITNGILIDSVKCSVVGNTVIDSDSNGTLAIGGITLTGLASRTTVTGNQSYRTSGIKQDYGIDIQAGCTNACVVGNNFFENTTAGILDNGTTTTLANNIIT